MSHIFLNKRPFDILGCIVGVIQCTCIGRELNSYNRLPSDIMARVITIT